MKNYLDTKQLSELLNSGIDIELISFELEIPIEYLKECKRNIDMVKNNNKKPQNSTENRNVTSVSENDKENSKAHKKMNELKRRYRILSSQEAKQDIVKKEYNYNKELVDEAIEVIENQISKLINCLDGKEIRIFSEISKQYKKIQDFDLYVEQAERLYNLSLLPILDSNKISENNRLVEYVYNFRKSVKKVLVQSISTAVKETNNIEELKDLSRKLPLKDLKNQSFSVASINNQINTKIIQLQQIATKNSIYNISDDLKVVVRDIANGEFNYELAMGLIEAEAKREVESRKKTKFSLTQEQEVRIIINKIEKELENKAQLYPVKDAEGTIQYLSQLNGGKLDAAIITVVNNFTRRNMFDEAVQICRKYTREYVNTDEQICISIKNARKQIMLARTTEWVKEYLTQDKTEEEEKIFLDSLETRLKVEKISMASIILGKKADNINNITLEEIYEGKIR